jgi:hypothetical protein
VTDDAATGRPYYFSSISGVSQWEDPRGAAFARATAAASAAAAEYDASVGGWDDEAEAGQGATPLRTKVAIAATPLVLLAGAMWVRIDYLRRTNPEALNPTKERRDRKRTNNWKFRMPKARGKMNQDGKGGRSNNT